MEQVTVYMNLLGQPTIFKETVQRNSGFVLDRKVEADNYIAKVILPEENDEEALYLLSEFYKELAENLSVKEVGA